MKMKKKMLIILVLFLAITTNINARTFLAEGGSIDYKKNGNQNNINIQAASEDANGTYIAVGYYHSNDFSRVNGLIYRDDKTNPSLSRYSYVDSVNNEYYMNVKRTSDGGYIIVGATSIYDDVSQTYSVKKGLIIKYDAQNKLVFSKSYDGFNQSELKSITEITPNEYIAVGVATNKISSDSKEDGWLLKIDGQGNELSSKVIGETGVDVLNGIEMINNNNFIISGYSSSSFSDGSLDGSTDGWLVKINNNLEMVNSKAFRAENTNVFSNMTKLKDGSYVVVGNKSVNLQNDIWLVKFDDDLNVSLDKNFDFKLSEFGMDVLQASDNGLVVVGSLSESEIGSKYGAFVLRLDSDFNEIANFIKWDANGDIKYNALSISSDNQIKAYGNKEYTSSNNVALAGVIHFYNLKSIVGFNSNGASGTMINIDVENAYRITLPKNTFIREGYDFMGWATTQEKADANEVEFLNEAEYNIDLLKDTTLFAVWQKSSVTNKCTISYLDSDIALIYPKAQYNENDKVTIKDIGTYNKTGFTFKGWNTKVDGSGMTYLVNDEVNITSDLELYAIWQANVKIENYSITYYDGNKVITSQTDLHLNDKITIKDIGTYNKEGYTFKGWNTKADGSGITYLVNDEVNITSNLELYAIWQAIKVDDVDEIPSDTDNGSIKKEIEDKAKKLPSTGSDVLLGAAIVSFIALSGILIRKKLN